MRLEHALSRLDSLVNWEKKARADGRMLLRVSLDPIRDLMARLGSPERAFLAVHVAGSKGKGTTAALVASALQAAGLRVALYTSPHVERVNERLWIGGQEIGDEPLTVALEHALAAREAALAAASPATDATWFDLLTAAAFVAIAEAGVEVGVIECGLGGRLDSTNVCFGRVAAVTNVYLEHTAVLGATRTLIAHEKAGIVKPGAAVVVGALSPEDEAATVVEATARGRGARCVRVQHAPEASVAQRNAALARAILAELARAVPALATHDIETSRARLPGRAEHRRVGATRVVLDGAHVPESLELVLRDLSREPGLALSPVVVIGMGLEKNARGLLKALVGGADRVLCSSVGEGPYRDAAELEAIARELGLAARAVPDPRTALDEAVRIAGTSRWVLVTGSLHLVGALRRFTRS